MMPLAAPCPLRSLAPPSPPLSPRPLRRLLRVRVRRRTISTASASCHPSWTSRLTPLGSPGSPPLPTSPTISDVGSSSCPLSILFFTFLSHFFLISQSSLFSCYRSLVSPASMNQVTPWFSEYRDYFLRNFGVSDHEFFEHPVACIRPPRSFQLPSSLFPLPSASPSISSPLSPHFFLLLF